MLIIILLPYVNICFMSLWTCGLVILLGTISLPDRDSTIMHFYHNVGECQDTAAKHQDFANLTHEKQYSTMF